MLLHPINYHHYKDRLYSGSTLYFATVRQSQQNCPRSSFQNRCRHSQVQGLTRERNLKNRRLDCFRLDLHLGQPYCRHFPLPTDRPPAFCPPYLPYPVGFPYFRPAYSEPGCDSVSNCLYRRLFAAYHLAPPRLHFWDYPLLPHRHCLYFLPKPPPYLDCLVRMARPVLENLPVAHLPLPLSLFQKQQGRQVLTACPPT